MENECGIKNGDFFVLVALMLIDNKTWTFDKSWLTRVYQALDIIERNDEVKKLFQKEEVENVSQSNDRGGSAEENGEAAQETSSQTN